MQPSRSAARTTTRAALAGASAALDTRPYDISHTVRTGTEVCTFDEDGSLKDSTDVGASIWTASNKPSGTRGFDEFDVELELNVGIEEGEKIQWHQISVSELLALRDCLSGAIDEAVRIGALPGGQRHPLEFLRSTTA